MFRSIRKLFNNRKDDKKHHTFINTISSLISKQVLVVQHKITSREQLNNPYCRGYVFGCCEALLKLFNMAKDGIGPNELANIMVVYMEVYGEVEGPKIGGIATSESEKSYAKTITLLTSNNSLRPNHSTEVDAIEEFAKGRIVGSKDITNFFEYEGKKSPFGLADYFTD